LQGAITTSACLPSHPPPPFHHFHVFNLVCYNLRKIKRGRQALRPLDRSATLKAGVFPPNYFTFTLLPRKILKKKKTIIGWGMKTFFICLLWQIKQIICCHTRSFNVFECWVIVLLDKGLMKHEAPLLPPGPLITYARTLPINYEDVREYVIANIFIISQLSAYDKSNVIRGTPL
jgi:hypothetical protein